jgi:hypothetical protein
MPSYLLSASNNAGETSMEQPTSDGGPMLWWTEAMRNAEPKLERMLRRHEIACQEVDRRWSFLLGVTEKILREHGIGVDSVTP